MKDEDEGEGDEGDLKEYDMSKAIPLKTCLFCCQEFDDLTASLDHMWKHHGFFIPFVEFCIDVEGLMTYLGEKVGVGHVCLWCNGRVKAAYVSTKAVQQHMDAKSHCRIRLETEEEEDEFLDFFNFPDDNEQEGDEGEDDEGDMKDEDPSAPKRSKTKRGPVGMNEYGEVLLADGTVIGTRSLKRIYRQAVRPRDSHPAVLIARELAQRYGTLALTGSSSSTALITTGPQALKQARSDLDARIHQLRSKQRARVEKIHNTQHHFRKQMLV